MKPNYKKAHRYKKKKPIYKNRFFWLVFLIILLIFSVLYFLFFFDFFWIKDININQLEKIKEEEIDLLIRHKMEKNFLFFPSQSIFLVDLPEIKQDILSKFPIIDEAKIKRKFPSTLEVALSERRAEAVIFKDENYFALDKKGVVFEEVSSSSFPVLIKIIDKREYQDFFLGKSVMDEEELENILKLKRIVSFDLNIPVKHVLIYSANYSIKKLTVETEEGWQIYFDLRENLAWQIRKLAILLEEKIPLPERKKLEYIELRFGNFANPKYSDEEEERDYDIEEEKSEEEEEEDQSI